MLSFLSPCHDQPTTGKVQIVSGNPLYDGIVGAKMISRIMYRPPAPSTTSLPAPMTSVSAPLLTLAPAPS